MTRRDRPRTSPPRTGADPFTQYCGRLGTALGDVDDAAQYEGTPWLTGIANFCAVVGTLLGCYALIGLIGYLPRGFAVYWPMVLILALDLVINASVQMLRFRRRRAEGLTRAERRRRVLERQAELRRARVR
jgi:hypothetical protein